MYSCINCAGNLLFDIESGKLKCSHCKSLFDTYEVSGGSEASEEYEYEVTVFTCPQCSGRIYSLDTQALAYCSFCGASSVLEGRLESMERPKYIIPFTVSEEDCKRIFTAKLKKESYTPNWLKNAEYIDSFRGIYVPYWIYNASQKGPVEVLATKTIANTFDKVNGYSVYGELDCDYHGVAFDASAAFEDDISEQLAPYDMRKLKPFSPAFLSGFYADVADVKEDVYMSRAEEIINKATTSFIDTQPELYGYNVEQPPYASDTYRTLMGKAELAMLPVWLLTYRRNGRVAHVAINGQSGKMAASLPIDRRKYINEGVFSALPLFALIGLMVYFLGDKWSMVITSYIMALVSLGITGIYAVNMKRMWEIENLTKDKGFHAAKGGNVNKRQIDIHSAAAKWMIISGILGATASMIGLSFARYKMSNEAHMLFSVGLALFSIPVFISVRESFKEIYDHERKSAIWWLLLSFILELLCFAVKFSGLISYALMIVTAILCSGAMLKIVGYHNHMITRKLPQYKYGGGFHND